MGCREAEGEDEGGAEKMGSLVDTLWIVIGLKKNNLGGCEVKDGVFKDFRNGELEW